MKKNGSGFTLIELLIVIAILGTLAVALLAAIDPFEQFKKAGDTGRRNTTQEFYNAAIRYYAQRNGWTPAISAVPATATSLGSSTDIVGQLVTAGELKDNFAELAGDQLNKIYVARVGSRLLACFNPESKSMQAADKNTKFTNADLSVDSGAPSTESVGQSSGTCKLNGGTTDCYWCLY